LFSSGTVIEYPIDKVNACSKLNMLAFTSCEIYWKNSSDLQGSCELAVNDNSICYETLSQYWSSLKLSPNTLFHSSIRNAKTVSSNLFEAYPSFPWFQKAQLLFAALPLLPSAVKQEVELLTYLRVSLRWVWAF
jgi:hypothetical protein